MTSIFHFDSQIPKSAKFFGWFLVCAGFFFSYVYMFYPSLAFSGISLDSISAQFGLYSTGVRILGSVIGIFIALILDKAALFGVMLLTRICIELGDIAVGLVIYGGMSINIILLLLLAIFETYFLIRIIKIVR